MDEAHESWHDLLGDVVCPEADVCTVVGVGWEDVRLSTSRSLLLLTALAGSLPPLMSGDGLLAFNLSETNAKACGKSVSKHYGQTDVMTIAYLVAVQEVRVCGVDIARLHATYYEYHAKEGHKGILTRQGQRQAYLLGPTHS